MHSCNQELCQLHSLVIILHHLKGKAAPETKVTPTWVTLTSLFIPRHMEAMLALSQEDTIPGQGRQGRCKLLNHILKPSAMYVSPFDQIKFCSTLSLPNIKQVSPALLNQFSKRGLSGHGCRGSYFCSSPKMYLWHQDAHLSGTVPLSKAESH